MSELMYRHEINLFEIADEYAKRLEAQVDEMALDKAADTLERFGYVKVVRCRDYIYYTQDPDPIDPGWPMMCERTGDDMVEPYGFCWRG